MKRNKEIWCCVLLILLALVCVGCRNGEPEGTTEPVVTNVTQPTVDPVKQAYKEDPVAYVVFTRSTEPRDVYVPIETLMKYESQYPDCNGTWFRDTLSGEDLCIYNAYLYAMEHQFIWFELYVEDSDRDFGFIRDAVALDSPFMEQSRNQYGEWFWKQPINYLGKRISISTEQFTEARWEKKMEALEACRRIVADIPEEYTTQEEKMKYVYRYVCDHITYVKYENQADEDYLYDAVCKGETVCDGYSNMLNLLFNLIGVECSEAMGRDFEDISQATEEQLKSGHTWVVAELDGKFYNFDPTFEDSNNDIIEGKYAYFGISDDAVSSLYLSLEETRPKCTDNARDYSYAHLIVENCTDDNEIQKIAELTEKRAKEGKYTTVVAVRELVSKEQYEHMIDRYGYYSQDVGYLETVYNEARNSTVMRITVTLR